MPRNVEIKAKLEQHPQNYHKLLVQLCGPPTETVEQEDTFFNSQNGRLKLRELVNRDESDSELIFYERNDEKGPKLSDFVKVTVPRVETAKLKEALSRANGTKGTVKKRRILYIYQGQTRVHMDSVEGLGDFLELEVCLHDDQSVEDGQQIAFDMLQKLGIPSSQLLQGAYMDMLSAQI